MLIMSNLYVKIMLIYLKNVIKRANYIIKNLLLLYATFHHMFFIKLYLINHEFFVPGFLVLERFLLLKLEVYKSL